jgi:predicted alpha/beta-fold hydrolase
MLRLHKLRASVLTLSTQSRVMANQFDTLITIKFGGSSLPFPFPDAHAYYVYSSSYNKLDRIRIPFLALNADDDPIASWAQQDYDDNEWFTRVNWVGSRRRMGQATCAGMAQGNRRGREGDTQKMYGKSSAEMAGW